MPAVEPVRFVRAEYLPAKDMPVHFIGAEVVAHVEIPYQEYERLGSPANVGLVPLDEEDPGGGN